MASQRIFSSAILTLIALMLAGLYLQSPVHVWLLMTGLGAITGFAFKTGQRHVITGFGFGIAITLVREALMYGPQLVEVTGLVYAAGYLFAVATSITIRTLWLKFSAKGRVA